MIDRQALVAQALRECDTLAEAERRVEALLRHAGLAPAGPEAPLPPAPAPPAAAALLLPAPPRRTGRRYQWHRDPELCARAAALLDNAGLFHTARVLECTADSIRHAFSRGYLNTKRWRPDPINVARGYKSAMTRGREPRDYPRAERALDEQDALAKDKAKDKADDE